MTVYTSEKIIKVKTPLKSEIWLIRFLIFCGIISMLIFVHWFVRPEHIGYLPVYWLLTFALVFKLVKMIHEWYHYWSPSIPSMPESHKEWTVDVLTTSCPGEPREMIIQTLKAIKAIRYPHTSYLCDEGNDPVLKQVCSDLGVVHVTRTDKTDAKAGNINNALKQASSEICLVLDPDHEPVPDFLDRVLPYFENENIGYVQCVQAYGNQNESFIARGAAEQTYHFYGPMMMSMNTYGTVQTIGANCTFRRKALDSIGGHAAGLAEDMHTAMQLHAKGWKSVYVPEILTRGLVPATLSSYYSQQLKWSRGTFELLFRTFPTLYKHLAGDKKYITYAFPCIFYSD
jgi:cellulose synthase (UDP-forming)